MTNDRARAARGSRSSARSSSASGTPRTTRPTSSATTHVGEVEVEDGVIYHKTEYRERRDHFAYFACSEPLAGFDTQREAFLGPYRGWDRPLAVERGPLARLDRARLGADAARTTSSSTLAPGETREVVFVLGYAENPADAKFDPPGLADDRQAARPAGASTRYLRPGARSRRRSSALRDYWTELLGSAPGRDRRTSTSTGWSTSGTPTSAWSRSTCRARRRSSSRASAAGMGFRDSNQDLLGFVHLVPARARERILDIAATQLADGGAYHQYQPLTKRGNDAVGSGFNDDPLWLDPRRRRLPQGDRRPRDPRRAGALRQRAGPRDAALRAPAARAPLHARPPRPARPAADRPRRLERLPQPQLLLRDAGRVVPDDRATARAASPSRCSSPACSCLAADELRGARRASRRRRPRRRVCARRGEQMIDAVERARLGRRVVPARLRLLRQRRSAPPRTTRARSSSSRRASASWPASGSTTARRRSALDVGRASGWRRRTASSSVQPAYTRYHLELGEISSYPPGLQGERRHLLPHQPVDHDRRDARRQRRRRARLLPADQPVGARGDLSEVHRCEPYVYAQMIAGPRRADARRGQELVAHRHGRLELRRDQPVDPRHPPRARRPADRPVPAGRLGRLHRPARLPGRDVPDHRSQGERGSRPRQVAPHRRARARRKPRPRASRGPPRRRGRRDRSESARSRMIVSSGRVMLESRHKEEPWSCKSSFRVRAT